jgi:hypothetical protein
MKRERNFLNISNWIFWIVLGIILFMLLPYFKNGLYNENEIESWLATFEKIKPEPKPVPENDTIPFDNKDTTSILKWRDFENNWQYIKYKHPKDAFDRAESNRLKGEPNYSIYSLMYEQDKVFLQDLIHQMKKHIKRKNLDYMDAMSYVCSSIQFFKYTLINTSDKPCPCEESFGTYDQDCSYKTGRGCCSGVDPFAVYSPFEFCIKHTGDCDTRSLLAFTLLKEMGFDVAVMVSESEGHSVLGVSLPFNSHYRMNFGTNEFGKKYYLWELTNEDWRFGIDNVKGADWKTALQ